MRCIVTRSLIESCYESIWCAAVSQRDTNHDVLERYGNGTTEDYANRDTPGHKLRKRSTS